VGLVSGALEAGLAKLAALTVVVRESKTAARRKKVAYFLVR
jgi:hypothetical protein